MFEHRRQPLLPKPLFYRRLLRHAGLALAVVAGSLWVGIAGYHFIEGLSWIDSLLNASMILTGMGPANNLQTTPGKLFAAGYALFSGLVFLAIMGILFAPILHRFLHKFHLELESKR